MIFFAAIAACSSTDGGGIDDVPETGTDGRADAKPDTTQEDGSLDATTDQKARDASDAGKDADADSGDESDADSGDPNDAGCDADADSGDPNDAGNDAEPVPVCRDEHQTCKTTDDCCAGLECGGGGFVLECLPMAPQCVKEGGDCGGKEPCCDGLTCNANNQCEAPAPACRQQHETCNNTDMLCCEGLECGGGGFVLECLPAAPQCVKEGGDCGGKDACCDGLTCNASGKCEMPAPACVPEGSPCNDKDKQCCAGHYCASMGILRVCEPNP